MGGAHAHEAELDGDIREERTKLVASRGRLLRRVDAWDDELRDEYTRMCADRAHELARGASPPLEDWEALIEPSVPEGPALLGFMAARIAEGEATVNELAKPSPVSLPAISRHLKVLERAGLIVRSREAQWRPSRLQADPLDDPVEWMQSRTRTWEARMDRLDAHLRRKGQQHE